jgi:putative FmdB family regulatory protein
MPIYEYCCEKCGREFEEWQKFSDDPVEQCEECGGRTRRLISHSSFVLKGTGWYVTDYGRKDGGSMSSSSSCKSSESDPKSTSTEASTSTCSSTE